MKAVLDLHPICVSSLAFPIEQVDADVAFPSECCLVDQDEHLRCFRECAQASEGLLLADSPPLSGEALDKHYVREW